MNTIKSFAALKNNRNVGKPKNWQFHIRKGEYPRIKWYVCSAFEYTSHEEAKAAADRYCISKGVDPMRVKCYTVNRLSKKFEQPVAKAA
jgi:hypothetical protein